MREVCEKCRSLFEELQKEILFLKQKDTEQEKRIQELEGKIKEKNKPDFIKDPVNHYHRKTGQKEGHQGVSRETPEEVDEIKDHALQECPYCGGEVSDTQEIRERVITDIPEVRAKNIKHRIPRCYCPRCDKIVEPEILDALPGARFGLRLMLLVLILKLDARIPSKKIISLLETIYGLKISDGEIYGILKQLSRALGSYYQELVEKIKQALVKHIDETGWRINGKNHWLWIFINREAALYVVRKQRSGKVPVKILGKQEGKTIVSDRLVAYNQLSLDAGSLQQICWTHILRNSKELAEHYREAKYIHRRLKQIYKYAISLDHKASPQQKEKLLYWIDLIAEKRKRCRSTEVKKFVKSVFKKHRDNLFRFVDNPLIDSTNNLAERGLRHAVVIRKISNGSRSKEGARVTGELLSVLQTMKMQFSNPIQGMLNVLQKGK